VLNSWLAAAAGAPEDDERRFIFAQIMCDMLECDKDLSDAANYNMTQGMRICPRFYETIPD
jgi:hypothetical protein